MTRRANAWFGARQYEKAVPLYTLAAKLAPAPAVYLSNRSACYQAQKLWNEAVADARRVVKAQRPITGAICAIPTLGVLRVVVDWCIVAL